MRILVSGGVRSGKSKHAEALLSGAATVTYVAPGRRSDGSDLEWDTRVASHRDRRPPHWNTVESTELARILGESTSPVLIDCLGTWLTAVIDGTGMWEATTTEALEVIEAHLVPLCTALAGRPDVVLVTNEVGLGVIPSHRSGVLFRDLLGTVNQRIAAVCDEVHLVISGRVLTL